MTLEHTRVTLADVMPGVASPQAHAVFEGVLDRVPRESPSTPGLVWLRGVVLPVHRRFTAASLVREYRERTRHLLDGTSTKEAHRLSDVDIWCALDGWVTAAAYDIEAVLPFFAAPQRHRDLDWRAQVRVDLVRVLATLRGWHLVLATRFVQRGWLHRLDDYFLLTLSETGSVLRGVCHRATLRALVDDRRARHRRVPSFARAS